MQCLKIFFFFLNILFFPKDLILLLQRQSAQPESNQFFHNVADNFPPNQEALLSVQWIDSFRVYQTTRHPTIVLVEILWIFWQPKRMPSIEKKIFTTPDLWLYYIKKRMYKSLLCQHFKEGRHRSLLIIAKRLF